MGNSHLNTGLTSPREGMLAGLPARFGLPPKRTMSSGELYLLSLTAGMSEYVKKLQIPVSSRKNPDGKMIRIKREVEKRVPKTRYKEGEKPTPLPADSMDIGTVKGPEDIPFALPTELLYMEEAPEEFARRYANRELLRTEWREPTRIPVTSYETIRQEEYVEVPAPPEEEKQHAYVLLDVSGSMDDEGKSAVARALALEFLRSGYDQRSQLALRPFAGWTGTLASGRTMEDLGKITDYILTLNNHGGTNIQQALEQAVADITAKGDFERADILLITDGDSTLGENPLGKIKLHTVAIGNGDTNETLQSWSTTYQRIAAEDFRRAGTIPLEKKEEFLQEIQEEIQEMEKELKTLRDEERAEEMKQRLRELKNLLSHLQEDPPEGTTSRIQQQHKKTRSLLSRLLQSIDEKVKSNQRTESAREQREQQMSAEQLARMKQALGKGSAGRAATKQPAAMSPTQEKEDAPGKKEQHAQGHTFMDTLRDFIQSWRNIPKRPLSPKAAKRRLREMQHPSTTESPRKSSKPNAVPPHPTQRIKFWQWIRKLFERGQR